MEASFIIEVLKNPKGFVKVIQIVLAICAFATTAGFTGVSFVKVICKPNNASETFKLALSYPFKFNEQHQKICNDEFIPFGDFSGSSGFYVFVGVITFLFCLGAFGVYVFFQKNESIDMIHPKDELFSNVDFISSIVIILLWFIASVAWASGVTQMKYYSSSHRIRLEIMQRVPNLNEAIEDETSTYGGLNISLIFGFANVALWTVSQWFLWKDTSWFKQGRESFNDNLHGGEASMPVDGSQM